MNQNVIMILASGSPRRKELLQQAGISFSILVSEADETSQEMHPADRVMELAAKKGRASADQFKRETNPEKLRTLLPAGGGVLIIAADTLVFSGEEVSAAGASGGETSAACDSGGETSAGGTSGGEEASPTGVLGKPVDAADALKKLMHLSGKTHEVYTGVYLELLSVEEENGKAVIRTKNEESFAERTEVEMYPFSEEEAIDYIATGEPMDKAGAYGIQGIGARLVKEIRGDYNNVVGFPLARFIREAVRLGYLSYGNGSMN